MYDPDTRIPEYVKQEFLPDISGLEGVVSGYQAAADNMYNIPIPKHMQHDTQFLQEEYLQPITNMREQAIEAWTNGSPVDGLRAAKELDRFLIQSKQPGGAYDWFERRFAREQKEIERVEKEAFDKGRQDLIPYLRSRIGYNKFRNEKTGQIQDLGALSHATVLAPEDLDKWANEQLPWVKETLKGQGYGGRYPLDQFHTLHDMYKVMGVDFNKVMVALAGRLPNEYRQSVRQDYASRVMNNPANDRGEGYDPAEVFERDEEGNYKFDENGNIVPASTEMGRWLGSIAYGAQYTKRDDQYFKVSDEVGIDRAKKAADEQAAGTMRTGVYSTGIQLPGVKFDSEGKVITKIDFTGESQVYYGFGFMTQPEYTDQKLPPKVYFQSEEFRNQNPVGYAVWQNMREKATLEGWDDKTITKKFSEAYKIAEEQYKTQDFTFEGYNTAKVQKENSDLIIGTESAPGTIAHSTLYIMEEGKAPVVTTYGKLMKDYKIGQAYLNKSGAVIGEIKAGENTLPEGKIIALNLTGDPGDPTTKGKQEKTITIIATDAPIEEVQMKTPQYNLAAAAFDPKVEKTKAEYNILPAPTAGMSEEMGNWLTQINKGIYSQKQVTFESDLLLEGIRSLEAVKAARIKGGGVFGSYEEKNLQDMKDRVEHLRANPEKDAYKETRAVIYSSETEEPMLINDGMGNRVMTTKDLNSFMKLLKN